MHSNIIIQQLEKHFFFRLNNKTIDQDTVIHHFNTKGKVNSLL